MHSKWQIWDFFGARPEGIMKTKNGLYSFCAFDPYALMFVKDCFPKEVFENSQLPVLLGKELTVDWLEDNLCTLGFFGNSGSYLVQQAEEIPAAAQAFLLERDIDLSERYFILFFGKKNSFYEKLVQKEGDHVEIQEPPFWHINKFLDFLLDFHQLRLNYDAKTFLLSAVENTCASLVSVINLLKLNFVDHVELRLEDIRPLVPVVRVDQFGQASLLSAKKFKIFYEKLLETHLETEDYIKLFFFLQSHLAKLLDPSYVQNKQRPSKYDQEILRNSRLWQAEDLLVEMRRFSHWCLLAKSKSPDLLFEIRQEYLKHTL